VIGTHPKGGSSVQSVYSKPGSGGGSSLDHQAHVAHVSVSCTHFCKHLKDTKQKQMQFHDQQSTCKALTIDITCGQVCISEPWGTDFINSSGQVSYT